MPPPDTAARRAAGTSSAPPWRVLVVVDSATVRMVLKRHLNSDDHLEVVGVAADGIEAMERIAELKPDVVTLAIEMPRLDGLGALERIMRECPTRVVMVSSVTREGAEATIRALELGAVDFIEKQTVGGVSASHAVADEVTEKVRHAAAARLPRPGALPGAGTRAPARPAPSAPMRWLDKKVIIGASTGGPQALRQIFSMLPDDIQVPIMVVQHMPPGFTASLAERLDQLSPLHVREATAGAQMERGTALVAPGGMHMTVDHRGVVALNEAAPECGVRPAVNVTMQSMVEAFGDGVVGAVLTGMGNDGTRGAGLIHAAGGVTIVQVEESCVVWGMPRSIEEAGYADRVVPLDAVARALVRACAVPRATVRRR